MRSLAVVAGMKNPEWPRRADKSRTLKKHHPYDIAVRESSWLTVGLSISLLRVMLLKVCLLSTSYTRCMCVVSLRRSFVRCKSFSIKYVTSKIICVCLINVTGYVQLHPPKRYTFIFYNGIYYAWAQTNTTSKYRKWNSIICKSVNFYWLGSEFIK